MKNIIIGTAGHIDHGKTSLIRALTGIETDRLKEEKKRGITIELGFAYMNLENGEKVGIVDVPGHEKFIKNMLAGAGGIDFVLLVIAADEGVMPQTKEHLNILSLLNTKMGIVVLTKVDLVDEEWLELVKEDINVHLKGTFLACAPIFPVSTMSGLGIAELKSEIIKMTGLVEEKNNHGAVRIPIDRVFTIDGFGTVATGTQIEGVLNAGDAITVYPQSKTTKVKNIQVHGKSVTASYAGQRVAINLANFKKEEVARGNALAKPDSLYTTMILDVKLNLLKDIPRPLTHRSRVRFYNGTSEVLGRVVLLDNDLLDAGKSGFVQLQLEETVALKVGDPFVIRYYSPVDTIGGGIILDVNPTKHKRFKEEVIEDLKIKETGSKIDVLEQAVQKYSSQFETIDFIALQLGCEPCDLNENLKLLLSDGLVIKLFEDVYIHKYYLDATREKAMRVLKAFHQQFPFKPGMNKQEFKNRALTHIPDKSAEFLIEIFASERQLILEQSIVYHANFKIVFNADEKKILNSIVKHYKSAGFTPPSIDEALQPLNKKIDGRAFITHLAQQGILVKVDLVHYFHKDFIEEGILLVKGHLQKNNQITLAEFRDLIGASRKYAIALLEYYDRIKITKKVDDYRIMR